MTENMPADHDFDNPLNCGCSACCCANGVCTHQDGDYDD